MCVVVFKASFWRTIPYSGKIYITDSHFCFRSKILAGQQKLIVPWEDVIQITKLKSRSYYLMYGMTMIVKNLTEEVSTSNMKKIEIFSFFECTDLLGLFDAETKRLLLFGM